MDEGSSAVSFNSVAGRVVHAYSLYRRALLFSDFKILTCMHHGLLISQPEQLCSMDRGQLCLFWVSDAALLDDLASCGTVVLALSHNLKLYHLT